MKNGKYSFIFDLDGTLYEYDKGYSHNFHESLFHKDIKNHILDLIGKEQNINNELAIEKYNALKKQCNGDISKAISTELNLSEKEYHQIVWNLDPNKYVKKDDRLKKLFSQIEGNFLIVTGAPMIWAKAVLEHLEIDEIVGKSLVTCEFPYRKPDIKLFEQSLSLLHSEVRFTFSIGDDEDRDILPAKKIGIKTLKVGNDIKTVADLKAGNIYDAFILLTNNGYIN